MFERVPAFKTQSYNKSLFAREQQLEQKISLISDLYVNNQYRLATIFGVEVQRVVVIGREEEKASETSDHKEGGAAGQKAEEMKEKNSQKEVEEYDIDLDMKKKAYICGCFWMLNWETVSPSELQ